MTEDDCIFCKIVKGEIPSTKVYEDDKVYAFDDLNPQMPVHTLIVPKNHYGNLSDEIPEDELGYLFNQCKRVAKIKGIEDQGYRVIVNNGDDAKQTVHHLHVHIMGGGPMCGGSPAEVPGEDHNESE